MKDQCPRRYQPRYDRRNCKERHGGKGIDLATACTLGRKAAQRIVDVMVTQLK
jgi:hypothetical protein